jgi:large subunit ribosomal protein L21
MYAIVATGGKQLVVEKDTVAVVEKLDAAVGESVTLPALFVADGENVTVGAAAEGATVTATVVEHFKGDKQIVFKFKKRKGYKRMKGHRQLQTSVLVTDISLAAPKKAAKKAAVVAESVEAIEAPAQKPAVKKPAVKKPVKKAVEAAE